MDVTMAVEDDTDAGAAVDADADADADAGTAVEPTPDGGADGAEADADADADFLLGAAADAGQGALVVVASAESSVTAPQSHFAKDLMGASLNAREGEVALHRALNGLNDRLEATEKVFRIVPEPAPLETVLDVQVSGRRRHTPRRTTVRTRARPTLH